MQAILLEISRYALPLLGLGLALICVPRLLRRGKSQAAPSAFLLNTVNHDRLPLPRFENSLGRSKHCDVVLNYPAVSRFHAVIARRRAGWVVVDTGSRGGTRLDGQPVERRAPLRHGQALNFGSFDFIFCDEEDPQNP
ncbi:MAG: FHA domain-containing protein [Firmicutes bacterium]|nr:FHA domain-containing protein [Bacillota bacterium]